MFYLKSIKILILGIFVLFQFGSHAEVSRIEILQREQISTAALHYSYEKIEGIVYLSLDPQDPKNAMITDIEFAPTNSEGRVEYAADFKLLVPSSNIANRGLLYMVNNRGRGSTPPEISLSDPLSELGFTYLLTGWINEIEERPGILRLHAPIVSLEQEPITGEVRYEVSVSRTSNDVNIAGGGHLAYEPTESGLRQARLSERAYLKDPRIPLERSQFALSIDDSPNSNQKRIQLSVDNDLKPGVIYELIYEAKNPVLAGAGMSAIRDLVSLIRHTDDHAGQLVGLGLHDIEHTVAYGFSQSGRLLRQYLYDGFNQDLEGRKVFDGVVPFIAGGGYGMFNNRFAMPTRTNGHHSNYLYPNDLFPFTYGDSTDPFSGLTDGILKRAMSTNTAPKIMHIQTTNEYWLRAGSLPHTNPEGTKDVMLPAGVRFYTIGGSQHGSGNGIPRPARSGQLPPNPSMWNPIGMSLVTRMYDWVAAEKEPPPSRYPLIENGSLVESHVEGSINQAAWKELSFINHPSEMYKPTLNYYGERWAKERIIDEHPTSSDKYYNTLVPAVDRNNNDLSHSTILPPTASVPLATYTSWNMRAPQTGGENSLARLSGGYVPYARDNDSALANRDQRDSIADLYDTFEDYLQQYETATDSLIQDGYLLPGFKSAYMGIARAMESMFD